MENLPSREDFLAYEEVREDGEYNMFDPNARALTGLDKDTYISIIRHYDELSEKYGADVNE